MKINILLPKSYKKPKKPIEPIFCNFYLVRNKITKESFLIYVGSTKDDGKVYYFKPDGTMGIGSLTYLLRKADIMKKITDYCSLNCYC